MWLLLPGHQPSGAPPAPPYQVAIVPPATVRGWFALYRLRPTTDLISARPTSTGSGESGWQEHAHGIRNPISGGRRDRPSLRPRPRVTVAGSHFSVLTFVI
jgi:hypothetical protein